MVSVLRARNMLKLEELKKVNVECSKDMTTYKIEHPHLRNSAAMFIQFTRLGIDGYANLSVGTQVNGDWLDHPFNSNPDALAYSVAMVLMAIRTFLERYPRRKVVVVGIDAARNRLYRMIVGKTIGSIQANFKLAGLVETGRGTVAQVEFEANRDYIGFVVAQGDGARPP